MLSKFFLHLEQTFKNFKNVPFNAFEVSRFGNWSAIRIWSTLFYEKKIASIISN